MNVFVAVGGFCLVAWAVLVYGLGIGSGWVHVLAAAGFVLVARGVITPRRR